MQCKKQLLFKQCSQLGDDGGYFIFEILDKTDKISGVLVVSFLFH